jgi:hypothetical protein
MFNVEKETNEIIEFIKDYFTNKKKSEKIDDINILNDDIEAIIMKINDNKEKICTYHFDIKPLHDKILESYLRAKTNSQLDVIYVQLIKIRMNIEEL